MVVGSAVARPSLARVVSQPLRGEAEARWAEAAWVEVGRQAAKWRQAVRPRAA